jgi:hypothetical protein
MWRRPSTGWLLAAGILLAACGASSAAPRRSSPSEHHVVPALATVHWLLAASALRKLEAAAGPAWTEAAFNPRTTTLIVSPAAAGSWRPWAGHLALDATSLAGVRAALAVATPGDAILLDLEHWPRTPPAEQADAAAVYEEAGALLQGRGIELIAAPATDLALVLAPGQRVDVGFLASGVVPAAARAASMLEIQAQGLEANTARYVGFVEAVVAEARSANPSVRFALGLSTNPSGQVVSPAALAADIAATRRIASAYWLNIPSAGASCPRCGVAQPQVAISLLEGHV